MSEKRFKPLLKQTLDNYILQYNKDMINMILNDGTSEEKRINDYRKFIACLETIKEICEERKRY